MPKHPLSVCAAFAFTGMTVVHCRADPTNLDLSTNAPPPPLNELLSTNVPIGEASTNTRPLTLDAPPLQPRGPKLASPSDLSPALTISPSPETSRPGRSPGIYLTSPYTMQVMVPGSIDDGMTHSPSANYNFDMPVHNPGMEWDKP